MLARFGEIRGRCGEREGRCGGDVARLGGQDGGHTLGGRREHRALLREIWARCERDMGEMRARHGRDASEIWARCERDMGEMRARYGREKRRRKGDMGET